MSEVWFYHLTQSSLEGALPLLLEKSLDKGWRVLVRGNEQERIDHLDRFLWTYNEVGFLPHGKSGTENDERQPILLTAQSAASNDAAVLVLIDGAQALPESLSGYDRVMVIFDGNDDAAVADARGYWKSVTSAGLEARYWAQDNGKWVQKG